MFLELSLCLVLKKIYYVKDIIWRKSSGRYFHQADTKRNFFYFSNGVYIKKGSTKKSVTGIERWVFCEPKKECMGVSLHQTTGRTQSAEKTARHSPQPSPVGLQRRHNDGVRADPDSDEPATGGPKHPTLWDKSKRVRPGCHRWVVPAAIGASL